MKNEIRIYNSEQFGHIRTAGTADNPMFCLSDICRVLELRVQDVRKRIDARGVDSINTPTLNQHGATVMQQMYFINEKNLYRVIMRSDKPQAEPFQDWVCGEVLPSIRKHGMYATEATVESMLRDPESAIIMLQAYQKERKERLAAQEQVERLEAQEVENRPKVIYADAVAGSSSACLIGELAKMIA